MKMMIPVVTAWATALVLALPAGALAQQASTAEGADIYARTCGRCHNARSPLERTDREWTVIVAHMRVRGNLTGQEERAVRAFMQAMNRPGEANPQGPEGRAPVAEGAPPLQGPVDAALVQRGLALVQQNGCAACHQVGSATTGTLGPNLNTVFAHRTPDYVLQKLANPRFDNGNSLMPQFQFSAEDRRAILEYLRTLKQ